MRFPRLSTNLLDPSPSGRRKGWGVAALLFVTIFLIPSLSFAPQTSATQVRVQSPALATEDLVEFVGAWPYGPCQAAAIDAARKIAVIGNGETLQVLDISTPSSPSKIGEVWLPGNPQGIALAGNYAYVVTLSYLVVMDITDAKNPSVVTVFFLRQMPFPGDRFFRGADLPGLRSRVPHLRRFEPSSTRLSGDIWFVRI